MIFNLLCISVEKNKKKIYNSVLNLRRFTGHSPSSITADALPYFPLPSNIPHEISVLDKNIEPQPEKEKS